MKKILLLCSETEQSGLFIVQLDCLSARCIFYRPAGIAKVRLILREDMERVVLRLVREYEAGVVECFLDEEGVECGGVVNGRRWERGWRVFEVL